MCPDDATQGEQLGSDSSAEQIFAELADVIRGLSSPFVRRVAIDGVDGAGKTCFADELCKVLQARGERVIRASVDGFHHPRAIRYRSGRFCPDGFYRESYDYPAIRRLLLDPLGPGGSGHYVTANFDHRLDAAVSLEPLQAHAGDILVFDGIFVHRPELTGYWDLSVLLHIDPAESMARLIRRDGLPIDSLASIHQRYARGQKLYFDECAPASQATIVLDNNRVARPHVVRWSVPPRFLPRD